MVKDKVISAIVIVAGILIIIAITTWLANYNPTICVVGWVLALLATLGVSLGASKR